MIRHVAVEEGIDAPEGLITRLAQVLDPLTDIM